jgi:hypothetical protein
MKLNKSDICCGVYQLSGIQECKRPAGCEEVIKEICKSLKNREVTKVHGWVDAHSRPPVLIFSDNMDNKAGEKLAAHIRLKKLGKVQKSCVFGNSSVTTHKCRVYIWYLDYHALGIQELLENFR